jgi:hypothetical protein
MPVRPLATAAISLVIATTACRAQAGRVQMDADAWRQDLRFLVDQITTRHPNPFHATPRAVFEDAVTSLASRIPSLNADEVEIGLLRVAAMVGDEHTRLSLGAAAPHYPYELEWLDGTWRITRAASAASRVLGARVMAFDDVPADTAWARVAPLVPNGESEEFTRWLGGRLLALGPVLHGLHIARSPDQVTLRVVLDEGSTETVALATVGPDADIRWVDAGASPPLSRTPAMRRSALGWAVLPGTHTAYVAWNNYLLGASRRTFQDSVRAAFLGIDSASADRVVLDLRWNHGGDLTRGREYLLAELRRRERLLRPGALYVLIGRETNSAAMVNAIDLKRAAGAILVGEPTGARPNSYSEAGFFHLPRSGLEGTVAICRYDLWPQDVPGVPPDHLAPPNWADYRTGRDSALEWILAQPPPNPLAPPARGDVRLTPPCARTR